MAGLPGPGDRIEARCTRCNDITRHVIVALSAGNCQGGMPRLREASCWYYRLRLPRARKDGRLSRKAGEGPARRP